LKTDQNSILEANKFCILKQKHEKSEITFIGPQAVKFRITNRELVLRTDVTRREVLLLLV